MLHPNRIWRQRLVDIGVMNLDGAFSWSYSGVMLRGCGLNWDLRKLSMFNPFYQKISFNVPLGKKGDCYDSLFLESKK